MKKYKTIYMDPPWNETGGGKIKRGADKHYEVLTTKKIIKLVKETLDGKVNDNCHLYCWVTNNHLPDGLKLVEELGFRYVTIITWMKDRIGLGQYFRGKTEHCLFAVKGKLPYKVFEGKRQQGVTGFFEKRTIHSKKPETMVKMIEKVSYAPRVRIIC